MCVYVRVYRTRLITPYLSEVPAQVNDPQLDSLHFLVNRNTRFHVLVPVSLRTRPN